MPESDGFWHNHESPLPRVRTQDIQADLAWLREHTTELK
jgi:hypothetical protein